MSLWVSDLACLLCMQNSMHNTRIRSLHGSQLSSVVLACKTATLGPELQVSLGSRHHLWFCACKTSCLGPDLLDSMGPSLHLGLCAFKTASL